MEPTAGFMTHVTCRLTAKNRDQLRNTTLGNRVWATFTFFRSLYMGATENARPENAGLENDGQNFSKLLQNYGVWKMRDWKMPDHVN